jgi:hypothetical protein
MTTRKRKPKGLGDTVENVLQATGIDKVAKWILGEDCGCNERKAKLNELFPYKIANCLTEQNYNYLTEFFTNENRKPSTQLQIFKIYNETFGANIVSLNCDSCWNDLITELKQVYETYNISE